MATNAPDITITFNNINEFPTLGSCNHDAMETAFNQMRDEIAKFNDYTGQLENVTEWIEGQIDWAEDKAIAVQNDVQTASNILSDIYTLKAQIEAIKMQNMALLPSGSINDGVVAINTTYSSQKIEDMVGGLKMSKLTTQPTIQINEGETVELFSGQGSKDVVIFATPDIGEVQRVDDTGEIFYTAPSIDADTTANVIAYKAKLGYLRSDDVVQNILVKALQLIQISNKTLTDVTSLADLVGFLAENSNLRAVDESGIAHSNVFDYSSSPIKKVKLSYVCTPKQIGVNDGSTSTSLKTVDTVASGDTIIVTDDTTIKRIQVTAVDGGQADTTQELDVFGDGSCLACWTFDNTANDLSGNYNGTITHGNTSYVTGKFGSCISFNSEDWDGGVDVGAVDNRDGDRTISVWFKWDGNAAGHVWHSEHRDYYLYVNSDGMIRLTWHDDDGNFVYTNTNIYADDNQWHHAFIYVRGDYQYVELTIDNTAFESASTGGINTNAKDFNGFGEGFTGQIDQARYFNKKLTQDEKDQIYSEEGSAYTVDISSAGLSGTVVRAYRDLPIVKAIVGGTKSTADIEGISINGTSIKVQKGEFTKDGDTLQFEYLATNVGDIIESVDCEIWAEG